MSLMHFDRYCAEIVTQTDLARSAIETADLTTPVPSCPGWNVGQVLRHLGGGQRWAETIVRSRATQPPPDDDFRDLSPYADEDRAVLDPWLAEGAGRLAATLRAAGPDAEVWTPPPLGASLPMFWARRFAYETLVHGADAALALGAEVAVEPEVAVDAIDEWMQLGSLPFHFEVHPQMRELLGAGRTIHLHATDVPDALRAEWVVDLTGEAITWRRAHEKCAVAVRGPVTDLLLLVYRRKSASGCEVLGDAALLDFWLARVPFG